MKSRHESAISEITGSILIIILVVALAGIITALVLGIPLLPNKPVLAAFSADTVMGAHRGNPAVLDVPIIRLSQMAGDPLIQEFTQGTHSAINGTKVKIMAPDGKVYPVVSADSLKGKDVKKGTPYYVFHYHTSAGEAPWYWLTNDPSRVFSGSGVEPFTPHGTWRLLITEEKDTNMILYSKDLTL